MEKTQYLLSQVGALLKSYEKIARSTGENFNIFTVMGMESNEVKTHSAIIGELLNPKGSHGLGAKPLKLFINLVVKPLYFQENKTYGDFKEKFDFDFESTYSKVEDFAGKISEDATEGGRIDIVIKDNSNKVFLIENKVYAGEQKNQLIRYNNYYRNAPIFFLTLSGNDAESAHTLEKNKDYFTISYEKDILQWLQECLKEAVKFPMLREVINQYINLIKKLTNQTINNELKMDVKELIRNNFLEASEIASNFGEVKNEFIKDFFNEVAIKFNQSNEKEGWEMFVANQNNNLYYIKDKNWKKVALAIWKKDAMYYGVKALNQNFKSIETSILNGSLGSYRSSQNSLLWNDKFIIKCTTTEDVIELNKYKEEKVKAVLEFVEKMKKDLTDYCEAIEKAETNI